MYYSNAVLDSSRGTSWACLTFVTGIIWHEDQVQAFQCQLAGQDQAGPVRVYCAAPSHEVLSSPSRVQDNNGLAKHVEVYYGAIFLAPLVPLEPGVRLWVLMDIADDGQPSRARGKWQRPGLWTFCDQGQQTVEKEDCGQAHDSQGEFREHICRGGGYRLQVRDKKRCVRVRESKCVRERECVSGRGGKEAEEEEGRRRV